MTRYRDSLRRWQAGDDGLSLIELLIAMTVLAVAILGLAATASTALFSVRLSRDRQMAVDAVSSTFETARALPYTEVVLNSSGTPAPPATYNGETVLSKAAGKVPFERKAGFKDKITVRTYVTRVPNQNVKRVTVIASWSANGDTRQVTQSTLIAPAARGLPAPKFDLTPEVAATKLVSADTTTWHCYHHVLRNIGATDSYDWAVLKNNPSDGDWALDGTDPDKRTLKVNGNPKWVARAYLTPIPAGTTNSTPPADPETNATTHRFRDLNANGRPEVVDATGNPVNVETGGSAHVSFCYRQYDSSAASTTFRSVIHSRRDATVNREVKDPVVIGLDQRTLTLHDKFQGNTHQDHKRAKGNFEMDESGPTYTDPALFYDYDSDIDPGDLDGLYQQRGNTGHVAIWDYTFPDQTSKKYDDANLTLWTSWRDALASGSTAQARVAYSVVVKKVVKTGGNTFNESTLGTATVDYDHAQAGWVGNNVTVAFGSETMFEPGTILRVEVQCLSQPADDPLVVANPRPASSDCHLMYDHVTYRSRLQVVDK